MSEFNLTRLEKVISGPGSVDALGAEMDVRGVTRAVIVTGASLGRSHLLERVREALGARCAGVSCHAAEHAPAAGVRAISGMLTELQADAIVSFGGGSAIDSAKVAAASFMNSRDMTLEGGPLDLKRAFAPRREAGMVHVAIPTTLSAGAFTPGGGVTDEATHIKRAVLDARLQPCVVIHDPELCTQTPDALWVSTGIRVLDHAIETLYSKRAHPLSSALAFRAIRMIIEHLDPSRGADRASYAHRTRCLDAAWLSLYGAFNTGLGLSHALGHQIGPAFGIAHGVTSCLCLVPAMRFIAASTPECFEEIAEALRVPWKESRSSALACADVIQSFIAEFDVPTRLRDLNVGAERARALADAVLAELSLFDALRHPLSMEDLRGLLAEIHGGAVA
jgi:alcohol dehydrogenase class IV